MFEEAARFVRPKDLNGSVLIAANAQQFLDRLAGFPQFGVERIWVNHVGKKQRAFIEFLEERGLPTFEGGA